MDKIATLLRRVFRHVSFVRDERGQAAVELALLAPFLFLVFCGVAETANVIEKKHVMSALTREGANIASRGASMQQALTATRQNQAANGLGVDGGAIVSRIMVEDGVPIVVEQVASGDYAQLSRVARVDSVAVPYLSAGLREGQRYYVVELFIPYEPVTPLHRLFESHIPESLYDRSLF